MTIYQLECFIAVAEELNFSAAAERKIAPRLVGFIRFNFFP